MLISRKQLKLQLAKLLITLAKYVLQVHVLIPESIKEDFLTAVKEEFSQVKVGDPREDGTQVGPIISKTIRSSSRLY